MSSIVIDTHALIWYLQNSDRLSAKASRHMEQAIIDSNPIYFSAISLVELTYLIEKQRIPAIALQQLNRLLNQIDSPFVCMPLDVNIANAVGDIARECVPDMPDRIIVATAHYLQLPLISCDGKVRQNGLVKVIW